MKNYGVLQSCLMISLVAFTAWLTSVFFQKNKKREQNDNDKIMQTPLIIITGCDTGLGYSIVMRYLNNGHLDENQYFHKIFQFPMLSYKKNIIPKNIAIVAFCLNPSGSGAKRLLELSQKNSNIKLFVRHLDLTNADSITKGVTFVTNLLDQNFDENYTNNEIKCYSKLKEYFSLLLKYCFNNILHLLKLSNFFRSTSFDQQCSTYGDGRI